MRCRGDARDSRRTDYNLIRYRVDGLESITPIMYIANGQTSVRYGSQTTVSQGARQHVRVAGCRSIFHGARPILVRQRRRHAAACSGHWRAACATELSLPKDPVGEFIQINGRLAQDHRVARAEGRNLRAEPGQQRADSVQSPWASLQGNQREPDIQVAAHDARLWVSSTIFAPPITPSAARRTQPRQERRGRFSRADGRAAPGYVHVHPEHRDRGHGRHREHSRCSWAAFGIMNIMLVCRSPSERARSASARLSARSAITSCCSSCWKRSCCVCSVGFVGLAIGYGIGRSPLR